MAPHSPDPAALLPSAADPLTLIGMSAGGVLGRFRCGCSAAADGGSFTVSDGGGIDGCCGGCGGDISGGGGGRC